MKFISKIMLLAIAPYVLITPAVVRADETDLKTKRDETKQKIEDIRTKSKERVAELKKRATEKTVEVRSKACEARESNIENRLKNRVEAAKRHQEKFGNIYDRVKNFAQEKALSSSDINTAESKVQEDKTKVSTEISALESIDVNLNCSNPDAVAETIDIYKNQLDSVKSSLKSYRESIRAYSQAVKNLVESSEDI